MEELNKKLAEWAGLQRVHILPDASFNDLPGGCYAWDNQYRVFCNFTDSLAVCEKWLMPKLTQNYYLNLSVDDLGADARIYRKVKSTSGDLVALYQDKTPALALCKAIEKLIDEAEVKVATPGVTIKQEATE